MLPDLKVGSYYLYYRLYGLLIGQIISLEWPSPTLSGCIINPAQGYITHFESFRYFTLTQSYIEITAEMYHFLEVLYETN